MPKYYVGMTIYNTFEVEAKSALEAEEKVRELSLEDTLQNVDFSELAHNITYVEALKDEQGEAA